MSFRIKVFLTIATVVLLVTLLEGALDLAASHAQALIFERTARQLDEFADAVADSIELRGAVPIRTAPGESAPPRIGRYRILLADRVVQSDLAAFPAPGDPWIFTERSLVGGYRLEAAVRRSPLERFLANELLVDLVDLPLFLGLAFVLSWLLARHIIKPVRDLTVASEQLARQQLPRAITVPPGDDELSRMARSFNSMNESIHGYLERERSFTRYASHELRTPLAALKNQVERFRLGLAKADEVFPVLERNLVRMEEVIEALLALARSSERDFEEKALGHLLKDLLQSLPDEERQRVHVVERAGAPTLVRDHRLVRQALRNLLDNALRYSSGPVALVVEPAKDEVLFRVQDEGPGMPPDRLQGPFRPFRKGSDPRSGFGLGLSLVTAIAEALRGRLELSDRAPGLEAVFSLPTRGGAVES